ncbi:hypothetical protein KAR91_62175 [Candidatus Pacearchaeota archaeon]|nr:hypothetical protein [Candidatus Pacearchaeota archaeon]
MSIERDLKIIEEQPLIKILGEDLERIADLKIYKGKFVITDDGKFLAKIFSKIEWDEIQFFHDMILEELGVQDAKNMDIKEVIVGGGKMEVEFFDTFVECRLYGKSTIYGEYDSASIDSESLEVEIQEVFDLDDLPVSVLADFEA